MIDKIEQKSKKHLENVRLANAYETVSDISIYTCAFAKDYKKMIPYEESNRLLSKSRQDP